MINEPRLTFIVVIMPEMYLVAMTVVRPGLVEAKYPLRSQEVYTPILWYAANLRERILGQAEHDTLMTCPRKTNKAKGVTIVYLGVASSYISDYRL